MQHQRAVGGIDGLDQLRKKPDPRRQVETVFGAVGVDRQAVDVFHDHIWPAVGSAAAVDDPSDVRVFDPGQELSLGRQPGQRFGPGQADGRQLQRRLLLVAGISARHQIDLTHAASAKLAADPPGPQLLRRAAPEPAFVKAIAGLMCRQQLQRIAEQLGVTGGGFAQPGFALGGRASQRFFE